jgi:hypothetical protein
MTPEFDEITPHPPGFEDGSLQQLHERAYVVRSYRRGTEGVLIRGAVRDQKPGGLYIEGDEQALTVHHMIVDIELSIPSMEITSARAVMEVHPTEHCPRIEDHYRELVGLNISRGFTHKVRELFGGPRGCSHTTALLQAMAPIAKQSTLGFRMLNAREAGEDFFANWDREAHIIGNLNTCHVWAEGSEHIAAARATEIGVPVFITRRLRQLGRDPQDWGASR